MSYQSDIHDIRRILPRDVLRDLTRRSDFRGAWLIFHAYGVIGLAMAGFAAWPNPLTFLIALMLIGSRQMGLAILMHDAAHGVLFNTKRLNEFAGSWLCGYPVFADMVAYRHYHLKHHRTTQQADDPDLILSAPFPITPKSFLRKVFRDLTGQSALRQRSTQIIMSFKEGHAAADAEGAVQAFGTPSLWRPVIVNAGMLALFAASGFWWLYFALWLVPLITWFQLVLRIRNIGEHAVVPDNDDPLRNARTTRANLVERVFLAPYWVNFHVEHHLHMYIPCWQLPRAHQAMLKAGLGEKMEIQPGYRAVVALATSA